MTTGGHQFRVALYFLLKKKTLLVSNIIFTHNFSDSFDLSDEFQVIEQTIYISFIEVL